MIACIKYNKAYRDIVNLFVCFIAIINNGSAQNVNYSILDRKNIIHLLGYSRISEIKEHTIIFSGNITPLTFLIANNEISIPYYGIKFGMQVPIILNNQVIMGVHMNGSVYQSKNSSFLATSFNTETAVSLGYYSLKWFIAGKAVLRVHVGSYWKFYFKSYEDIFRGRIKSGWNGNRYLNSSSSVGVMYGRTFKQRTDLIMGYNISGKLLSFNNISLGLNYRIGKKTEEENQE